MTKVNKDSASKENPELVGGVCGCASKIDETWEKDPFYFKICPSISWLRIDFKILNVYCCIYTITSPKNKS